MAWFVFDLYSENNATVEVTVENVTYMDIAASVFIDGVEKDRFYLSGSDKKVKEAYKVSWDGGQSFKSVKITVQFEGGSIERTFEKTMKLSHGEKAKASFTFS